MASDGFDYNWAMPVDANGDILGGALNCWDVAEIFRDRFPSIRVVYASGQFSDLRRDVVESEFFAKPYLLDDILEACKR